MMLRGPNLRSPILHSLILLAALLAVSPVIAVEPDEILPDPALEARARSISAGLRCLVCQNQSIDDSNADLARDLRLLVRERLVAGDSDREVLDFVVDRYGTFVLLQPPLDRSTYILWFAPFVLALVGAVLIAAQIVRRKPPVAQGLTAEEETQLARILAETPAEVPAEPPEERK